MSEKQHCLTCKFEPEWGSAYEVYIGKDHYWQETDCRAPWPANVMRRGLLTAKSKNPDEVLILTHGARQGEVVAECEAWRPKDD